MHGVASIKPVHVAIPYTFKVKPFSLSIVVISIDSSCFCIVNRVVARLRAWSSLRMHGIQNEF